MFPVVQRVQSGERSQFLRQVPTTQRHDVREAMRTLVEADSAGGTASGCNL